MMMSASASDAPVSTKITCRSPATRNDFTTPRLGMAIRHGTIFTPSIGKSFTILTIISSLGKIRRGFLDRGDNVAVARAAAEIAGDRFFDLLVGGLDLFAEQSISRHQHARRTVAALDSVVVPERFLQRMQSLVLSQPFDCNDLISIGLHGKHHARFHCSTIP